MLQVEIRQFIEIQAFQRIGMVFVEIQSLEDQTLIVVPHVPIGECPVYRAAGDSTDHE